MLKLKYLPLILFFIFSAVVHAQGLVFTEVKSAEDWARVTAKSREENKVLFVDAYADWCGFCKKMDQEVFSDASLSTSMESSFIAVKIDGESDFGSLWVSSYHITAYPSFLFFTPGGFQIGFLEGYLSLEDFSASLENILKDTAELDRYEGEYQAGILSFPETADYIMIISQSIPDQAEKMAEQLIMELTREEFLNGDYLDFASLYGNDMRGKIWPWVKEDFDVFQKKYSEQQLFRYFQAVLESVLNRAMDSQDINILLGAIKEVLPVFLPHPEERALAAFYALKAYFAYFDDADSYSSLVEEYYNEKDADISVLFNEAQEILENYQSPHMIYLASVYLETFTEQAPESFPGWVLLTYSCIFLGEYDKAESAAGRAEEQVKTEDQISLLRDLKAMISTGRKSP